MDDESGWNAILVEGWGEHVRAAVCERVEDTMAQARGVLAVAVAMPDEAPPAAVERVHDAIVASIATETGANLDELGSQAAWATYDDVWAELGRRWASGRDMELVGDSVADEVRRLLALLPRDAIELAGGVVDGLEVRMLQTPAGPCLDVDGLFRWLAGDDAEDDELRAHARAVVALARRRT